MTYYAFNRWHWPVGPVSAARSDAGRRAAGGAGAARRAGNRPRSGSNRCMARWEERAGPGAGSTGRAGRRHCRAATSGCRRDDLRWVAANCRSVLHSAASLTFQAEEADGEPWRSNVARDAAHARRVPAGRHSRSATTFRPPTFAERAAAAFWKPNWTSASSRATTTSKAKLTAEKEVLAAGCFDQCHGLSAVDHRRRFAHRLHDFVPRLLHAAAGRPLADANGSLLESIVQRRLSGRHRACAATNARTWCRSSGFRRRSRRLVTHPECHGRTYHLTNPKPATVHGDARRPSSKSWPTWPIPAKLGAGKHGEAGRRRRRATIFWLRSASR